MKKRKTSSKLADHHVAAFDEFVDEFKSETDRAAVILGTSKIE
jgi:hypothetical protein